MYHRAKPLLQCFTLYGSALGFGFIDVSHPFNASKFISFSSLSPEECWIGKLHLYYRNLDSLIGLLLTLDWLWSEAETYVQAKLALIHSVPCLTIQKQHSHYPHCLLIAAVQFHYCHCFAYLQPNDCWLNYLCSELYPLDLSRIDSYIVALALLFCSHSSIVGATIATVSFCS